MTLALLAVDPSRADGVVLRSAADPAGLAPGAVAREERVDPAGLPALVARWEAEQGPRWVWDDSRRWYPALLAAGVRVRRCHDLRLCRTILRRSTRCAGTVLARAGEDRWDQDAPDQDVPQPEVTLFDDERDQPDPPPGPAEVAAELHRQTLCLTEARDDGRLRLLLAAESAGALIALELHHDGLPWRTEVHDALLADLLGPRVPDGQRPARLQALAEQVAAALDRPGLNPDSPQDLVKAMRAAGLEVTSTRRWEIAALDHPVVEPLLAYKKLARLLSANGWAWQDRWVDHGRFRPVYVPAGVVTGRWASTGGGALQLPVAVRSAVRADPGRLLVVADAAQLEPRVLAAMSGDRAMALAGQHADLYQAVVRAGIVPDRQHAKYAMLGAIYGATTGASAALMPQLTRGYPQAVALVEEAARAGERGEQVTTWLGRSSPPLSAARRAERQAAAGEGAGPEEARAARQHARDWGRFTRNFVVQGTAAEWALCWMALVRLRLLDLVPDPDSDPEPDPEPGLGAEPEPAPEQGTPPPSARAHLAFFLHDELMVHTPADQADQVAELVRECAVEAGRLLFGDTPVEFALDVAVVESYADAG